MISFLREFFGDDAPTAVNMEQNEPSVKVALGHTASLAGDGQRSLVGVSMSELVRKAFPIHPYSLSCIHSLQMWANRIPGYHVLLVGRYSCGIF